jgi:glycosyltransferase involved in cell wall biosynthesis
VGALTVASFPPRLHGNPYLARLQAALRRQGVETVAPRPRLSWAIRSRSRLGAVHLHWLELYVHARGALERRYPALAPLLYLVRASRLLSVLLVLRIGGARIVWTVHNLRPHESRFPRLDRLLARAVGALAHGLVVHSHYAHRRLRSEYPWLQRPVWVARHGHYVGAYAEANGDRAGGRRALGLPDDAFVFLVFGQLRPYKRVDDAIRAFRALESGNAHLVVAGAPYSDAVRDELVAAAGADPRVHLRLDYVGDDEVAGLHRVADAAIVAYPEVFSSGALLLALSQGLPVVAPRESSAPEVAEPPALEAFAPGGLTAALARVSDGPEPARRSAALDAAQRQSWDATAARVRDAYLGRRPDIGGRA